MVVADTSWNDNDPVFLATGSRSPIAYYTTDPRARVSTFGFTNTDPYASAAYDNAAPKGTVQDADSAITITFDVGTLAPDTSTTFTYYTSLDTNIDSTLAGISGNDADGIPVNVENSAPNNGDANSDATMDSIEPNVSSFVNPVTGKYASLEINHECSITSVSAAVESTDARDAGFDYPAGLMHYSADCGSPGFEATVKQYFYDMSAANLVVRKFNDFTKTYTAISGASISQQTIAGHQVAVATYTIKDGGPLDEDGVANGIIVDPSGPSEGLSAAQHRIWQASQRWYIYRAHSTIIHRHSCRHTKPQPETLLICRLARTNMGEAIGVRHLVKPKVSGRKYHNPNAEMNPITSSAKCGFESDHF